MAALVVDDDHETVTILTTARFPELPVIAITAWGDRERALQAGFVQYIAKPCDPLALRDTLESLVPHR